MQKTCKTDMFVCSPCHNFTWSFFPFPNLSLSFPSSYTVGDLPGCTLQRSALLYGWGCAVYPELLLEQVAPPLGCTSAGAGSVSSKVPERWLKKKKNLLCSKHTLCTSVAGSQKQITSSAETVLKLAVMKQINFYGFATMLANEQESSEQSRNNWTSVLNQTTGEFGYLCFTEYKTLSDREITFPIKDC